jgi:hypothetical protein
MRARTILALAAFAASACGDGLIPGTELDKLGLHVEGSLLSDDGPFTLSGDAKLGILWIDPAQTANSAFVPSAELVKSRIGHDDTFALDVYGLPHEGAIAWLKSGASGEHTFAFSWGEIVLYEDRDGDGTLRVGQLVEGSPIRGSDTYRGMPVDYALVYVARALPPEEVFLGFNPRITETPGYHLVHVDCDELEPRIVPIDPAEARVDVVESTSTFPNLRPCLRSHPDF